MSNSNLVSYTRISPNSTNPRQEKIKKITIHHMACDGTLEAIGKSFANPERQCSSNYAIDSDGNVAMYCEEKNRSWCSSSAENDHQAITIEVANCKGAPNWEVSDKALSKLIELCADICKRNNIAKLNFTDDVSGNLTMHKWFVATACPGPYLESKFQYIADEVNKGLVEKPTETFIAHKVQKGESWWSIAQDTLGDGSRYMELVHYNGFDKAPTIHPGDIVKIPCEDVPQAQPQQDLTEVAQQVIRGDFGNGVERVRRLTEAGYDAHEVQKLVNEMC